MVERPILRGAPDAIVAPPRPYGPRLHADRVRTNLNQESAYALPGSRPSEAFDLEAPALKAMDVFNHPYAYAA